jgi:hypothetical protein
MESLLQKEQSELFISNSCEISKKDKRRIKQRINYSKINLKPINFYVGTCPDYSNDGINYTFEKVGSNIPLLTKKQLEINKNLFEYLNCLWR